MSEFFVSLKKVVDDSYPVLIGTGLRDSLIKDIKNGLFGKIRTLAVITDDMVDGLYAKPVDDALNSAGFKCRRFVLPHGEKNKTREQKARIEDEMLAAGYRRDCAVIAVGGGMVTDLAGFLAGTFARGVPFVNYATTILAAADASVGGKTAVDTPLATNLIGLFHQPKKVYIDLDTWKTLPERQISNGLAETIKHACMADAAFFAWLEEHLDEIFALDAAACTHMAEENLKIKYRVVMEDEREAGLREILNLGHTVGRAVETASGYRLLHGEAVAIGLAAQARLSVELGYLSMSQEERILALLKRAGLPVRIPAYIDAGDLLEILYTDKKVREGTLRFVLQDGIGHVKQYNDGGYASSITKTQASALLNELI